MESNSVSLLSSVSEKVEGSKGTTSTGKALVVDADYFALTSRIDPNVIFWTANDVAKKKRIPADVEFLWISSLTLEEHRLRLQREAKVRGIEVWGCAISELCIRLLPFWFQPTNRSLVIPANPEDDKAQYSSQAQLQASLSAIGIESGLPSDEHSALKTAVVNYFSRDDDEVELEDRTGEDEDAIPRVSSKRAPVTAKEKQKFERMKLLRKAGRKAARLKAKGVLPSNGSSSRSGPQPSFSVSELKSALQNFSTLDSTVFTFHYEHGASLEATSAEFSFPQRNVQRILDKVWSKLPEHGFKSGEKALLEAGRRKKG